MHSTRNLALVATLLGCAGSFAPQASAMPPKAASSKPGGSSSATSASVTSQLSPQLMAMLLELDGAGAGAVDPESLGQAPAEHRETLGQWLAQNPGRDALTEDDLTDLRAATGMSDQALQDWFTRRKNTHSGPT